VDYDCPRAIVTVTRDFDAAVLSPSHSHPRGELLYAEHGTLTVTAAEGNWIAPPNRAIWIPAGVTHVTRHTVNTEVRAVFIRHDAVPDLPEHCTVVQVGRLLRELILTAVRLPALYDEDGADGRLVRVLLDRIAVLPKEPLHLPMPKTPKLRAIAVDLADRPSLPLAKAARYEPTIFRSALLGRDRAYIWCLAKARAPTPCSGTARRWAECRRCRLQPWL